MRPSHRNKVLPSFPWTKVSHNMILQDWNKKE
jgi:hypothetical protein